jgi:UDP-N-acetylmuramoyl-tripeptide--D-alanyl-D-alanine ligase
VALLGERTHGSLFIDDAVSRGAAGVLVSSAWTGAPPTNAWCFKVDDALQSLQTVARWLRDRSQVKVVGITGSVGKTSTREATSSLLSRRFNVLQSQRSFNSEIGLPLTLLELEPAHEIAVLEMGMYVPGDIRALCEIARPDIGVVTNVGYSHLERTGSLDRTADAKAELVESLPATGRAILNADDPRVRGMASRTCAQCTLYGLTEDADLRATNIESHGFEGLSFTLTWSEQSASVRTALIGEHNVYTALAASAVGLSLGMSLTEIAEGLGTVDLSLRLRPRRGRGGVTVLDDSYNASPASMKAALDLLRQGQGRKIAVLGDMRELGTHERQGHEDVGEEAASAADVVVAVGDLGQIIGERAKDRGTEVRFAATTEAAVEMVPELLRPGDIVLVKGSRAMAMERIVDALAENGIG